jgi:xylan 1,4-beta-xylosidase
MYSSYTAASYARLWELARRRNVSLEGALTWAFTFVGQPWFAGYRQLATNGVDLPVLNVFRLFARLGPEQLEATSSAEMPLEEIISNGVRGAPDVGVLATRADNGRRLAILIWHYKDDDVPGPEADIHLSITGLAPHLHYQARAWRIDQHNGDAFTTWKALGSPAAPNKQQVSSLIRASRMAARPVPLALPSSQGCDVTLERRLPLQGVELVEMSPAH